jgi:putative endonuclease
MKKSTWFVYIIENEKGYFYTGITTDIDRRLRQHSGEIKGGAKFFHSGSPVKVLFKKKFPDRSLASKFEAMVKKMKREDKIYLIDKKKVKA